MSRPSSAPLIPGPRPPAPVVSIVQTAPSLARSVSAAGRLGPDPSPATHSFVPQSYRNAMMGNAVSASSSGFTQPHSPSSAVNPSPAYAQSPTLVSAPLFLNQSSSERMDPNSIKSGFSFGMATRDVLQNGPQWMDSPQRDVSRGMPYEPSSLVNDMPSIDWYKPMPTDFPACTSGRQTQGVFADEFPHLDIINDLLDDEQGMGKAARSSTAFQGLSNGPHMLIGSSVILVIWAYQVT
ncbi:hypothetical protein L1049_027322 [Liquidambar formosana]|uniref:Uncharacterized protein n=1 Tax=Liquidambar formosana TaxID=63359 RepID=A0AAP0QY05_LIQFO